MSKQKRKPMTSPMAVLSRHENPAQPLQREQQLFEELETLFDPDEILRILQQATIVVNTTEEEVLYVTKANLIVCMQALFDNYMEHCTARCKRSAQLAS